MRAGSWGQGISALLINLDYRRLLFGTVIWWQCYHMELVVLGWLVFDITNSPSMVALVSFCRTVPLLLVGLFSSPIIDYFGRRPVVIAAQSANLSAYLMLALLLWTGYAAPWNIALVAFYLGTAWAIDWPTRRSLVPDLLGKEKVVDGLLLENFLTGSARIISPSIAGWLIANFGALGCYLGMAFLSASALAILFPLLYTSVPRITKPFKMVSLSVVGEGIRYARANQAILAVLLTTFIMNLWIFPYATLLPVFARDVLHKGPFELGLMSTATGIGSFLGLILIHYLRQRVNIGALFILGSGWACLTLVVFALSQLYPLSWSMLFLAGMGMSCFGSLQSTIILLTTSNEMRNRVMGILVLAIGGDPLGQLHIGALVELIGVQATLALQASVAAIVVLCIAIFLPGILQPQVSRD